VLEAPAGPGCPDGALHVWERSDLPAFGQLGAGWHWRFKVLQVGGDTILMLIRDANDSIETFLPTAEAFVDTIHFLP
jgi:hypothetical protein